MLTSDFHVVMPWLIAQALSTPFLLSIVDYLMRSSSICDRCIVCILKKRSKIGISIV
jgi:hypothetical protein